MSGIPLDHSFVLFIEVGSANQIESLQVWLVLLACLLSDPILPQEVVSIGGLPHPPGM